MKTGTKVEPTPRAVSPSAVSKVGNMRGNHAADGGHTVALQPLPMYRGRGLKAPMAGKKSHPKGSQGQY